MFADVTYDGDYSITNGQQNKTKKKIGIIGLPDDLRLNKIHKYISWTQATVFCYMRNRSW